MKKIGYFCLIILMIFSFSLPVSAKTLQDLKNELKELENKKASNEQQKKLTKQEREQIDARIDQINVKINKSEKNINELTNEIADLEEASEQKELEIKDIVAFLQVTDSNNAYLEYIFGAESITDLIYRSAISEQLVNYNDDLIEEYNDVVKKNKIKKDELKTEIVNLDAEQSNLRVEYVKLGDEFEKMLDVSVDIDDDIKSIKATIKSYEDMGCKLDENIATCGSVPYAGKMIRPLKSGCVSSNYGKRNNNGDSRVSTYHSGLDAYGSTDIYATAPGIVKSIFWKQSCGGTKVFIEHNINGVSYVTGFYHLYQVYVSVGDYVDQNTKIAVTGGADWLTPWDTCSAGRHMHISLSRGSWSSFNNFTQTLIDPRTLINFPKLGGWFSDRISKY